MKSNRAKLSPAASAALRWTNRKAVLASTPKRPLRWPVLMLAVLLTGAVDAAPPPVQDCVVRYQDGEGSFADRIAVTVAAAPPAPLPSGTVQQQASPFDTATLTLYKFDALDHGSGVITVALQPRALPASYISFNPAVAADAKWLNENLVFIRAWWGRVLASEMVFDTSTQRFLYRKLADYAYSDRPDCQQLEH